MVGVCLATVEATMNLQYDDNGVSGVLFWIGQVFQIPFWAAGELLFSMNDGTAIPCHRTLSIVLGLLACVIGDFILRLITLPKRFSDVFSG